MSWHFSRALVEEYSAATSSDGARSALSSGSPIPPLFLPKDRMMAFSRLSRFGMTFGLLTDDLGGELLTWFRAGFPARTSAPPAEEQGSTANAPAFGGKWQESLAKYDPASRSWRTRQFSLLGDSEPFSETWPRWGMTVAGESFRLPTPERPTSENESGFWPSATTRGMLGGSGSREMGQTLVEAGKLSESEAVAMLGVKLWPTPNVPNGGRSTAHVTDWRGKSAYHNGKKVQVGLESAVKSAGGPSTQPTYPTPTAVTNTGGAAMCKWGGSGAREKLRKTVTPQELNGSLNPEWVEWLMGWPLGWTDLKPLETGRFQTWCASHGIPSAVDDDLPHLSSPPP